MNNRAVIAGLIAAAALALGPRLACAQYARPVEVPIAPTFAAPLTPALPAPSLPSTVISPPPPPPDVVPAPRVIVAPAPCQQNDPRPDCPN
jgi:hypothetical protein